MSGTQPPLSPPPVIRHMAVYFAYHYSRNATICYLLDLSEIQFPKLACDASASFPEHLPVNIPSGTLKEFRGEKLYDLLV